LTSCSRHRTVATVTEGTPRSTLSPASRNEPGRPGAPLLLLNARVRTLNASNSSAEALLLVDGRIAAVGTEEQVAAVAPAGARRVDLRGNTLLPGLIDAHTHLEGTSLHLAHFADCHVPPHWEIAGILQSLAAHAGQTPPGEWVIGQGSFMLAEKLAEGRLPTLAEMDAAVPDHPAAIRAGAHVTVVNSRALQCWGIDERYVPPVGAEVGRDADGIPNGILTELWWSLNPTRFTPEQTEEAIVALGQRLSSYGVTSLSDQFPSPTALRVYQKLRREGRLPLRISFTVHCPNAAAVDAFLRYGLESGFGDEWLKLGAVKFFVDGGITGSAGAFYEPYVHLPGHCGHLKIEQDELNAMVRKLDAASVQASVHVVGDRALDMLLDAFGALPDPARLRHRLEHAGHLCMTPERIARIRDYGLVPVMTMPFLSAFGDFLEPHLGSRAAGAFALRRLLEAGLRVPGSSDSLGAQPESLNPLFGIWCAVERQTYLGRKLATDEAVSAAEALQTYTTFAAWADWEEHRKGSLAPGMLADVIICAEDPVAMPPARLRDFTPEATILGGRLVSGSVPDLEDA
jgi:predicted amidohydrolase YtcJ